MTDLRAPLAAVSARAGRSRRGGAPGGAQRKGGAPGFVKMPDDKTLLFPCFDGNGMYFSMGNIAATEHVFSMGNIAATEHVGLMFMDFETPMRLRVQGDATLTDEPAIAGLWPVAQFAVQVRITALITNCPRYRSPETPSTGPGIGDGAARAPYPAESFARMASITAR